MMAHDTLLTDYGAMNLHNGTVPKAGKDGDQDIIGQVLWLKTQYYLNTLGTETFLAGRQDP